MYSGVRTTLGNLGASVGIRRGVKQGDPLSPLLFNLVLDPLIQRLEHSNEGFRVGGSKLTAMAYADDITLFADSAEGMEVLLGITTEYLHSVGMSLSAGKSGSFHLKKTRDAWVALPTVLAIQGQPLKSFAAGEVFQYLGSSFSLSQGFNNRQYLGTLVESAGRVRRLSLKPNQKVQLLMQYVVPAFAHRLTIDPPSGNDLTRVDRQLRGEVKKMLHLLAGTTDSLLYARKRDGGLGFPRLGTQVKICALRAGLELLAAEDGLLQDLGRLADWRGRLEALAADLGLDFPTTRKDILQRKNKLKDEVFQTWQEQRSQGVGVQWFRNDIFGNRWLLNQKALRPGQFIDALKMRTNTFGTRVAINRATRDGVTVCRRCHSAPETLGHVLGQCIAGKPLRIERHNWVVGRLEESCKSRGAVVAREQEFRTPEGQLLKPDLVVNQRDQVFVVDVTLPFENALSLSEAALGKNVKYAELIPTLKSQFNATKGEVIPVVIGARGAIPKASITALKKIGVTERRTLVDFALHALRTSIHIGRCHLDYG